MRTSFCNNCGQSGHLFQSCKSPITSIGIIAFRKGRGGALEYLLICRKDSLGYVDFIRGKYPIQDKRYLKNIFSEMTVEEKYNLKTKTFDDMWNGLWGKEIGIQYRGEEKSSRAKYERLKNGVSIDGDVHSIDSLIRDTPIVWGEPEWGFPKGRRNYHEKDISCALREFEEETGYKRTDLSIMQNIQPVEEIFTGSNYKSYKHKYFIAYMSESSTPQSTFEDSEVSQMKWMNIGELLSHIRPYNIEKRKMIYQLNSALTGFCLYS